VHHFFHGLVVFGQSLLVLGFYEVYFAPHFGIVFLGGVSDVLLLLRAIYQQLHFAEFGLHLEEPRCFLFRVFSLQLLPLHEINDVLQHMLD